MRFPHFPLRPLTRTVLTPGGLSPSDATDRYTFRHTENLITERGRTRTHSPKSPLVSPDSGDGLTVVRTEEGEQLCYPEGHDLVVGTRHYPLALKDTAHRLIPFGDLILIFPERKYLRLSDGEIGMLDASLTTDGATLFTLCRADGSPYTAMTVSDTAPASPAHGDVWLDTAFKPVLLRRFSTARQEWQTVTDTYLRISAAGIGRPFRAGDTVRLTNVIPAELKHLEGLHRLLACEEDHLVISAPPCVTVRQMAPLGVTRRMPDLDPDTLLVWRDRLVGAAQAVNEDGTTVTLLCAGRVGDPFNWEPTDGDVNAARQWRVAYAEPITASAVYHGMPHFFSEQSVLALTGEGTSARWQMTPLAGVMDGCGESLKEVGGVLCYRSRSGMMCYDGKQVTALPPLPWDTRPRAASAGTLGDRYYLSLIREDGRSDLLVCNVAERVWSRLDHTRAAHFTPYRGGLCYRDGCDGAIRAMGDTASVDDMSAIQWEATTAPLWIRDQNGARLSRAELMLTLSEGGEAQILTVDGKGNRACPIEVSGRGETPICVSIYPRATDCFSLEIRGRGKVSLHELTRITR